MDEESVAITTIISLLLLSSSPAMMVDRSRMEGRASQLCRCRLVFLAVGTLFLAVFGHAILPRALNGVVRKHEKALNLSLNQIDGRNK